MKTRILLFCFLLPTCTSFGQHIFNDTLSKQLVIILNDDQKYRYELDNVENKDSAESQAYTEVMRKMCWQDSINEIKVCAILDKYGWLGIDEVGDDGNRALWSVIQHSDMHLMAKYMPMMKEAVRDKKILPGTFALLEDRMAIWQGRKQVYGTQVSWNLKTKESFVLPLDDPDNVDKRRAAVGLPPLAQYLSAMDVKWDLEQYKKDLPDFEAFTWRIPWYDPTLCNDVGDIPFDERYDNTAFKTPDSFKIFVKPRYKGGKPAINRFFHEGFINDNVTNASGYITVHFYVSSHGQPGKLRMETMDFQYQPVTFDRSISFQILHLVWLMKGWEPLTYKDKSFGYYCYLNFKIVNGQISYITP